MIKVEHIDVWGFEHAIRGMRNPLDSHNKSDSGWGFTYDVYGERVDIYHIGKNDLDLMQRLYKAGSEHRKYLRQIFVSLDIIAPLYWWKEFDTYKIGTVSNSYSTMHRIHSKEFTLDDFSHDHLTYKGLTCLKDTIHELNIWRTIYLKGGFVDADPLNCSAVIFQPKDKRAWWQMIQLLPTSYNQKRTITMNYENVINMMFQRSGHKLDEWSDFIGVLMDLSYVKDITADARNNRRAD